MCCNDLVACLHIFALRGCWVSQAIDGEPFKVIKVAQSATDDLKHSSAFALCQIYDI